ncbi:MAG: DUF1735 domain-containing protein, partial [Bacteroidaceae bacterium]
MKRIYNIGWIVGGLMLLTGCEDNRDNNLSEPLIYIVQSGEINENIYDTGENHICDIAIHKSGLIEKEVQMELMVDETLLAQYNGMHDAKAELLPADLYQLEKSELFIAASERKADFKVTFKTAEIKALGGSKKYVLPLSLKSKGEVQTNPDKAFVIISPSIQQASIGFGCDKVIEKIISPASSSQVNISLPIKTDFPNKWDISFDAQIDPQILDDWNIENRKAYSLLSPEYYQLSGEQKLVVGKNTQTLEVTLDREKLPFGWYAIPVGLSNPSMFYINDEKSTCLITILNRMNKIPHNKWTVISCSTQEKPQGDANGTPEAMIDDNNKTQWHSAYSPMAELPHTIVFKLDKA